MYGLGIAQPPNPHHTKQVFTQLKIPTVHNLILQRLLCFMHKLVYKSSPPSILNLITIDHLGRTDSNHYTFNTPISRLKPHKNSIFAKGPQFYNHFIPLISNSLEPRDDPTHSSRGLKTRALLREVFFDRYLKK